MTLPNQTFRRAAHGTGTDLATHTVGASAVQYPTHVKADAGGDVQGTVPVYKLVIPPQAVGANKMMFDLFVPATGGPASLELLGLFVTPQADVAVTGVVALRLDWFRTSTVGTGGTAAVYNGTSVAVPAIIPRDTTNPALGGLSARAAPTGGATIAAWWGFRYAFPEETHIATNLSQFFNTVKDSGVDQNIVLRAGQGLMMRQGSVLSVGAVGFEVLFTARW